MEACVNSAGLVLDILGVVLLFFYGLPSTVERPEAGVFIEYPAGRTPEETKDREKLWNRHQCMSRLGLTLLVVGFVLQIVSNHM